VNPALTDREELLARAGWSRCERPDAAIFPTSFPGQSCWTLDEPAFRAYRVFVVESGYALEITHGAVSPTSVLQFPCFSRDIDFRPAFSRLQRFIDEGVFEMEPSDDS
jgi:hypothetical protein